jgi:hypothetical protein
MKTNTSLHHLWCSSNRGTKPTICQRDTEITKRPSCFAWILLTIAVLSLMPLAAISQEDHGSGGGGGGCGDVFGDLIHILRNDDGQPILAQRWVELPAEVPGYGWGYCPIAVYTDDVGDQQEIPFLPFSCDFDLTNPQDPEDPPLEVVEVDYFGRLNGGRTKERNNRMHFDEVISNIKAAHLVKTDAAGRLMLGYDCTYVEAKTNKEAYYKSPCLEWATIDSPMEHMGLYTRFMKYGHLATDPYEIDTWAHGDPKSGTPFHVALGEEDWPKFHTSLQHLLPNNGEDPEACWDYSQAESFKDSELPNEPGYGVWFAGEPFSDMDDDCVRDENEPFSDLDLDGVFDPAEEIVDDNGNCVLDEFKFTCAGAEDLGNKDFVSGAVSLASAASKTGMITTDLIQYFNRITKIAKKTEHTVSPNNTLPALYRDCWTGADPVLEDEGPWEELAYEVECEDEEADIPPKVDPNNPEYDYCAFGTPNHCLFPDLQERFVDFSGLTDYEREADSMVLIINTSATEWELPLSDSNPTMESSTSNTWEVTPGEGINLVTWMEAVNGKNPSTTGIDGFRWATSDFLRTIEFIHNNGVPEVLECSYGTTLCALD